MKAKISILTLCALLPFGFNIALAQSEYNNDALKKYQDEQMIAEYEMANKAQKPVRIDKSLPIDFDQVEHVWQRHAQRRPYNGTITSSLPLDPAYSSAFSPQKKKVVQRPRIASKAKKKSTASTATTKETTASQKANGMQTLEITTSNPTTQNQKITGPTTLHTNSNTTQTTTTTAPNMDEGPLNTLTNLDNNSSYGQNYSPNEENETALRILRTTDNTMEALEGLLKDNPKLQEEVKRLRLSQEAAIKDELNLPLPEYIEIVN